MLDRDWQRFVAAISGAVDVLQAQPLSRAALDLYFKYLEEYHISDVEYALFLAGKELNRFPRPKKILEILQRDFQTVKEKFAAREALPAGVVNDDKGAKNFWISLIRRRLSLAPGDVDGKRMKTGADIQDEVDRYRAATGKLYPDPKSINLFSPETDQVPF